MSGLVDQTRRVAAGNLDLEIEQDGPLEIKDLAADVELMREALASQIARLDRARTRIQQRSAELARSNADLEQFAYVASHDLSEPLRKVTNFCQLLDGSTPTSSTTGPPVHGVHGRRRQADAGADQRPARLLPGRSLHRELRAGRPEPLAGPGPTNLDEPIAESGAQVQHGDLPTVPGDPTLLTALLQNLVANSVKYRSPDRPRSSA